VLAGEKEGAEFIKDLNQRLTDEHRKIIEVSQYLCTVNENN